MKTSPNAMLLGLGSLVVAGGVLVGTADTTSAPEPANLGAPLGSTSGATAAATYVYSQTPTTVVHWPTTWTYGSGLAPGTPCSPYQLSAGSTTTMTIQAMSTTSAYRKCV